MDRTRTARFGVAAAAVTVLAAGVVPAVGSSAAGAAPAAPAFTQQCGGSSWWAGSTNVCDGAVVYRDYVYDDAGADEGDLGYNRGTQNAYGTLAHPAGDVRYPADQITTADLVALTLTRVGDRIDVVAELNALYTPDSTVLALAVDTDGDPGTGGGDWGELGVRSTGWDDLHTFDEGDPATNVVRGSFPLPAAPTFRVQAVTAQAATNQVMNVAYRGVEEKAAYRLGYNNASPYLPSAQGAWFEDDQAAALANGDISAFGIDVAVADLRPGVTRLQEVGPGLHERVYTSDFTVSPSDGQPGAGQPGEGMTYAGVKGRGTGGSASAFAQVFNFLGRYQPYGVYVPDQPGPYGLQMEWHGSNQGIVAQINQPGMQADFGDELNRLLVTPLARGPNGYGSDISERDLLDVMADAEATFPIDRERVFSSGYSQGGYIAFRMAMLHPDRFAGFTAWVGFTGNDTNGTPAAGTVDVTAGAVGNMIDYVGNLRHVPGSMIFGSADELVQVPSAVAMEQAFAATDSRYDWYMHTPADHFTFAVADGWQKEADDSKDLVVERDPSRVSFRTDPFLDDLAHGIRHGRAYWVSELRGREDGVLDTDLTSHGCGVRTPTLETGVDAGQSPVPWNSTFRTSTGTTTGPAEQLLEGTLSNVASLVLDLDATCLRSGFDYSITSDGPAVLRLPDGTEVPLVDGLNSGTAGAPAATPGNVASPAGAAPSEPQAQPGPAAFQPSRTAQLPATGASVALPVLAVAMIGLAAGLRRRRDGASAQS